MHIRVLASSIAGDLPETYLVTCLNTIGYLPNVYIMVYTLYLAGYLTSAQMDTYLLLYLPAHIQARDTEKDAKLSTCLIQLS